MKLGRALVRVVVGSLFVGHGAQKLFGWFGGGGLEGTGQFFESAGLRPGRRNALAAGTAEAGGGVLLALGLLMPLGAAALSGVMSTAIWTVHKDKGPWATGGGYEYPLVLLAVLFALTELGPGEWSLDQAHDRDLSGPAWALGELSAGVGGAALAIRLGRGHSGGVAVEAAAGGG